MRNRTSIIWKIPKAKLVSLTKRSGTLSDVLRYFGLENKGGNHRTLKKRLEEEKIDFSHMTMGLGWNKGKTYEKEKIPLDQVMVEKSTYSRKNLKRRLIAEGILKEQCAICDIGPEWNKKKLSLQLDHENGISNDCRPENLRLLCPNCHSQTDNFAGKGRKRWYWCSCGKDISRKATRCQKCSAKIIGRKLRKVKNRPTKETLLALANEVGYCEVGRRYGVSDNAIRKWLKN